MRALLAVDPAERSQLHTALLQRGWRVASADTPESALERFRARPARLVVVSTRLAGGDGATLCRALRATEHGGEAYLVALSPTTVPEALRPLVEAGVDDVIALPVAPSYLAMRLALAEYRAASHPGGSHGEHRAVSYGERVARLEHALRVQEASLEQLFRSAPEGIVVVDREARVVRVNDEFARLFGYPAHEAVGRPVGELIVPPEQEEEGRAVMRAALDGRSVAIETVRRHRDGRVIDVSLLTTPIRVGSGLVGAYGIYRDISERKAQERALAESEARYRARSAELEAAMRSRSRLYTAMNHELRTPISAIMLYQELLLGGVLGELAPEQARAMRDSHASAKHLMELVDDVLDLSRMEEGKIRIHAAPVRMGELLAELRATVLPLARRHGSDLHVELAEGVPTIVTDPQRLRQILLNLASNAAKFGEGRPIVMRCRAAAGEVVVEVEDRGVGIAPEELARIFDEFVQVGTMEKGGTGLGLAISRRLAGLLDGRLEVESELGVGSVFRLVVPARSVEPFAAPGAMVAG